jgi:hypothetical protein
LKIVDAKTVRSPTVAATRNHPPWLLVVASLDGTTFFTKLLAE